MFYCRFLEIFEEVIDTNRLEEVLILSNGFDSKRWYI